jgi:hypothetical protein
MGNRAREAHLVVELREARRIADEMIRKKLEGDGLTELEIVGPVDFAHPTAAERRDDPEAPGEECARGEASPVRAGGWVAVIARSRIARQHIAG